MSTDQCIFTAIQYIAACDLTTEENFSIALRDQVSLMAGLSSSDDFCLE